MKTDVEIAQEAEMRPIQEIAEKLGISDDELELYGKYKAKIDYKLLKDKADVPDGKLVLVTAISPTPAGEGKTTTTVGLGDGQLVAVAQAHQAADAGDLQSPRDDGGGFGIAVKLTISVPGVDKAVVEDLVQKAHIVCPYSHATRGNIDVDLEVA